MTNVAGFDLSLIHNPRVTHLRKTHGMAGYGALWAILGHLSEAKLGKLPANYPVLGKILDIEPELVRSVVEDFGVFEVRGGLFACELLNPLPLPPAHPVEAPLPLPSNGLAEVRKVVTGWKMLTGIPLEGLASLAWDKVHFPRCASSAKRLITLFGFAEAVNCMEYIYLEMKKKNLGCTIETTVKCSDLYREQMARRGL